MSMVSVKLLKPYCIKTDLENIYVYLDEEHFTISIQNEVYQFIPEQSRQFIINRRTKKLRIWMRLLHLRRMIKFFI